MVAVVDSVAAALKVVKPFWNSHLEAPLRPHIWHQYLLLPQQQLLCLQSHHCRRHLNCFHIRTDLHLLNCCIEMPRQPCPEWPARTLIFQELDEHVDALILFDATASVAAAAGGEERFVENPSLQIQEG